MKIKEEYNEFMTGTEHDRADEENIKNLYEKIDPDLKAVKGDKGDRGPRGFTGLQVVRADVIQNGETSARIKLVVQDEYEILTNEFDLPSGKGDKGVDGKNGIGINSIQQGNVVVADGFTETSLIITLDDDSQHNFVIKAKNGLDGEGLWTEAVGNSLKPTKAGGISFTNSTDSTKYSSMESNQVLITSGDHTINVGFNKTVSDGGNYVTVGGISGIDTRSITTSQDVTNKEYVDSKVEGDSAWELSPTGKKIVAKEGVIAVGVGQPLGQTGREMQMTNTGFVGWAADGSAINMTVVAGDGTKKGIYGIDDESINSDSSAVNKKYVDTAIGNIVSGNEGLKTIVGKSIVGTGDMVDNYRPVYEGPLFLAKMANVNTPADPYTAVIANFEDDVTSMLWSHSDKYYTSLEYGGDYSHMRFFNEEKIADEGDPAPKILKIGYFGDSSVLNLARIEGLSTAGVINSSDAATKGYVDNLFAKKVSAETKKVSMDTDTVGTVGVDWVKGATGVQVLQGEDISVTILVPRISNIKPGQYLLNLLPTDDIIQLHFPANDDDGQKMNLTYRNQSGALAGHGKVDLQITYFLGD